MTTKGSKSATAAASSSTKTQGGSCMMQKKSCSLVPSRLAKVRYHFKIRSETAICFIYLDIYSYNIEKISCTYFCEEIDFYANLIGHLSL